MTKKMTRCIIEAVQATETVYTADRKAAASNMVEAPVLPAV